MSEQEITISQDSISSALRAQRNEALDESAKWRAAYNELVVRANTDLAAAQRKIIEQQATLALHGQIEPEVTGPVSVPGMHVVEMSFGHGEDDSAPLPEALPPSLR